MLLDCYSIEQLVDFEVALVVGVAAVAPVGSELVVLAPGLEPEPGLAPPVLVLELEPAAAAAASS